MVKSKHQSNNRISQLFVFKTGALIPLDGDLPDVKLTKGENLVLHCIVL